MITGGTSANTVGWFRKSFTLPASAAGQSISLEFDGAYRNCLVWLNGITIGRNVSGYSSCSYDITNAAIVGGTNELVVRDDASRFEGWFYEGGGIYRHVWLVTTNPLHVAHWGTFVTSAVSGSNATLTVQTQVNNDGANSTLCNLISSVTGPNGNLVATATTQNITVLGGSNQTVTQTIAVANASLWSLSSPNLYHLVSTVTQSGSTTDTYNTTFGIRTVTMSSTQGLLLNGQRVEAIGACNHQDFAGVGTALPDRLQYVRIEKLKALGFTAIRTSHNSPTPALLDACDQLGMLVLDENRRMGSDNETLGELQRGITRDRNHPCIFMWSLANEEPTQGSGSGAAIMQTMQNLVHSLDSTRLCTVAMNGSWGTGFSTIIDVQGFNYMTVGSEPGYHSSFPNQPLIATEDGSQTGDRGTYVTTSSNMSAYDVGLDQPGWGLPAEQMWQYYNPLTYVAGFFDWTGFDYRGEPTPTSWPTINSHFGILDTCGFPKDNAWYFQANWLPNPVLHILPHWNWAGMQGQPISVWAFSNCDAVQLLLNGTSQGTQSGNVQTHLQWSVPYESGTLEAIGYVKGQPVITDTVCTSGTPAAVLLQPDRSSILSDGMDVSLVTASVVDSQGNVVATASNSITFTVNSGTILGVGNGNPNDHEADVPTNNVGVRTAFSGLALVLVQSSTTAGAITVTASSPGLASATTVLTTAATLPPPAAPSNVTATPGNAGQTILGWNMVPGAVSYNVKRSTNSAGPYSTIANTTFGYYTDATLANGTPYYYVVTATNSYGESTSSDPATVIPAQPPPTISAVNNRTIGANSSTGPIALMVSGSGTLTVTGSSSVSSLIPNANITITPATPWGNVNLGSVATSGSAIQGDDFCLDASGSDIWNTADAGNFAYQTTPVTAGTTTMTARVTSVSDANTWSKGGVMLRSGTTAGAAYAYMLVSAENGVAFQYRSSANGSAAQTVEVTGLYAPYWVSIAKTGTNFAAYYAPDNNGAPGTWTQAGSTVGVNLGSSYLEGLASTAHNNNGELCDSTYDNISGPANPGGNYIVNVTPAANASGAAVVALTVTNGTSSETTSFNLTVNGPAISAIVDQNIGVGSTAGPVAFTIGDTIGSVGSLTVSATSSNPALVPASGIFLAGAGSGRTITITPVANQTGSAAITITVTDGTLTASATFNVNVSASPSQSSRLEYFGTAQDSGSAADLANPAGDGVPNLIKYALGMNPDINSRTGLPVVSDGSGALEIQFNRNLAATDVSYYIQASDDMENWTTIASRTAGASSWSISGATVTDNNGAVTAVDNTPIGAQPHRFLQLTVSGP